MLPIAILIIRFACTIPMTEAGILMPAFQKQLFPGRLSGSSFTNIGYKPASGGELKFLTRLRRESCGGAIEESASYEATVSLSFS